MKKMFSIIFAMMIALCACRDNDVSQKSNSSDQDNRGGFDLSIGDTELDSNSTTNDDIILSIEGPTITSYDDIDSIYQFDLNGKHYALPCSISDFLDNEDTISEKDLAYTVPSKHIVGQIYVHLSGSEDSRIELLVANDSEQDMSVMECEKVVGVTVRDDANVEFILNSNIRVDLRDDKVYTFLENLQKAYGTEKLIYSENPDSYTWRFYKKVNSEHDNAIIFGLLPGMDMIQLSDSGFTMEYAGRPDTN